jgi:hypothetical protein
VNGQFSQTSKFLFTLFKIRLTVEFSLLILQHLQLSKFARSSLEMSLKISCEIQLLSMLAISRGTCLQSHAGWQSTLNGAANQLLLRIKLAV